MSILLTDTGIEALFVTPRRTLGSTESCRGIHGDASMMMLMMMMMMMMSAIGK